MPVLTVSDIESIGTLVSDRLGFVLTDAKYQRLSETVSLALEDLGIKSVAAYRDVLQHSQIESLVWQQIIAVLGNTESYFFREWSQFEMLRSHILPELIQRRSPEKKLTLWSAGCAAGEEAYSLAILLTELIPDIETWQIKILGTDVNTEALAIAARGEYGDWSLRSQPDLVRKYCLTTKTDLQQIKPELHQWVKFTALNLLDTCLPDFWKNVDLILCRHVFLHLEKSAIATVLGHLAQALKADGYFLTGHSELYGISQKYFRSDILAGSVVYQPHLKLSPQSPVAALPRLHWRSLPQTRHRLYLSDPIFALGEAI